MIKPTAFKNNCTGKILYKITEAGFRVVAMKIAKLSTEQAKKFYAVHAGRPFYTELVNFMSSGPIVAAILEKENAVEAYRKLIGATNPAEAAEGTIRRECGTNISENAVHGSDSDENAAIEASFFFAQTELY